jgi:hypothetical protein
MNSQQAIENLGLVHARILIFDQLNHRPDGRLTIVGRQERLAAKAVTESVTELEFFLNR